MTDEQQFYFSNAINILALALGIENLSENRQQSEYNDVHAANDRQAEYLLQEINRRFDEQNAILERLSGLLERIEERMDGNGLV